MLFRSEAGLDDQAHAGLGHVARRRGGLDEARHARQEAGCELLQHAPHREVEGIDVQRQFVNDTLGRMSDEDLKKFESLIVATRDLIREHLELPTK